MCKGIQTKRRCTANEVDRRHHIHFNDIHTQHNVQKENTLNMVNYALGFVATG